MLSRNDEPNIPFFNFAFTSVFNAPTQEANAALPPSENDFNLLNGQTFGLLGGGNLLLL